ncbi:GNAT family N-acetyltransferase [Allobranchiibius sp. GilTou73]|uniref:GNAT family N-acetyltransferase n=1 Tax=Allobranchiibius sp. GilTou73 TaxID=2904523 RepID=UPI001F43A5F3|nr:GNAT family N-acetyltransferase [Allobranchiibius sp. GilTou73]UIJ33936.1 GNAT family N-acetyltransferase [Allobranchiibius sp. GilTou73]
MQSLESSRLLLRPWSANDVDFVFDMYSRWEVQRFIGRAPKVMTDRRDAEAAIERWTGGDHPTYGIWAVQHREKGHLLGTLMLKPIPASGDEDPLPDSGDVEIGWHLHPDAWGHGYASGGGARVLQHAFDSGLARVVTVTFEANTASQAVARRIGMTHEGATDRYYNMTCELFTATHPGSGSDRMASSI